MEESSWKNFCLIWNYPTGPSNNYKIKLCNSWWRWEVSWGHAGHPKGKGNHQSSIHFKSNQLPYLYYFVAITPLNDIKHFTASSQWPHSLFADSTMVVFPHSSPQKFSWCWIKHWQMDPLKNDFVMDWLPTVNHTALNNWTYSPNARIFQYFAYFKSQMVRNSSGVNLRHHLDSFKLSTTVWWCCRWVPACGQKKGDDSEGPELQTLLLVKMIKYREEN